MKPDRQAYINYRLDRAHSTLAEARHLLSGGFTAGVANRLYYACFYAVSALLLSEGHSSSKHSGVLSLFNRLWIKTDRLPAEMGALYHLLFDQRRRSDYEDLYSLERDELEGLVPETEVFLERISAIISRESGPKPR